MFPTELYVLDDVCCKMCENTCKLLQFKEVFDMIVKPIEKF